MRSSNEIMPNRWLLQFTIAMWICYNISDCQAAGIGILQEMKYKTALASSSSRGLYTPEDKVFILTKDNFKASIYDGSPTSWLVEFYNSWCGHCKKFAPVWSELASSVHPWRRSVRVAAIDCADDLNNNVCRDVEILAYPTLIYFHENYEEGPKNLGETFMKSRTALELAASLARHMRVEQTVANRGKLWPDLAFQNFTNAAEIWNEMPSRIDVAFLVFEAANSSAGCELILDMSEAENVRVWSLPSGNSLARILSVKSSPALYAVEKYSYTPHLLAVETPSRAALKETVVAYLLERGIDVPQYYRSEASSTLRPAASQNGSSDMHAIGAIGNSVFQADLETGLRYTLTNEIPKLKKISGEALDALKDYLRVLIKYFPFRANGKAFIGKLLDKIEQDGEKELFGDDVSQLITKLENEHSPVYSTVLDWIGCKGSSPNFRGFTCSLWVIFHTLTVSAADKGSVDAAEVLRAMHGYVRHFFGCAECSEHFQAMALRNKMSSVAENDGTILWLWAAHNEVNHRLAGDSTEDSQYPKRQFPVAKDCPRCRNRDGNWNVEQVLLYLKYMYRADNISLMSSFAHQASSMSSRLSNFHMGIVFTLYLYCIFLFVFIVRLFFNKKIYRRKMYAHDSLGKV